MTIDPDPRQSARVAALGTALLLLVMTALVPDPASAALRSAAGGRSGDGGGFSRFVDFIDRLADYTIPIGSAFSVLGLIWGGLLFLAGDARAGRTLGFVVLGLAIVLLSKPIAA